jgi:hypothetical protein
MFPHLSERGFGFTVAASADSFVIRGLWAFRLSVKSSNQSSLIDLESAIIIYNLA